MSIITKYVPVRKVCAISKSKLEHDGVIITVTVYCVLILIRMFEEIKKKLFSKSIM